MFVCACPLCVCVRERLPLCVRAFASALYVCVRAWPLCAVCVYMRLPLCVRRALASALCVRARLLAPVCCVCARDCFFLIMLVKLQLSNLYFFF